MNSQINLRLPDTLLRSARKYAKKHGFGNVQEFIKETLRERLFPDELNKEEEAYIKRVMRLSEKHNLYGTEEDLLNTLRSNAKR